MAGGAAPIDPRTGIAASQGQSPMNWVHQSHRGDPPCSKADVPVRHAPAHPVRLPEGSRRRPGQLGRHRADRLGAAGVPGSPRLVVRRRKRGGGIEDMVGHLMLALIQKPNAFYDDIAL